MFESMIINKEDVDETASCLKVVNDQPDSDQDCKENEPEENKGIFASIRDAFTNSIYFGSPDKRDREEPQIDADLVDSVIIETKSSGEKADQTLGQTRATL